MTIPPELLNGPFTFASARDVGVSEKVLRGARFRRLFPRVWIAVEHQMTDLDWIVAATLAMPDRADLSHASRLRVLGLDGLELWPIHFTVMGDLHLDLQDILLHRTKVLPPVDEAGVRPAVAFLQWCADSRLIDAIKVGDWLVHRGHMSALEVAEIARLHTWRPGARLVRQVLGYVDAGSRSLKESETRAVLVLSGIPTPEVNGDIFDAQGNFIGCGDLVFRRWRLVVEYEGRQHVHDLGQWNRDIERYRDFRDHGWRYVQVTQEKLARPKSLVA